MRSYEGYAVGKTLQFLRDPAIISFAGGLPSSDVFPVEMVQENSRRLLEEKPEKIMQYSPIPGEGSLKKAVIEYLGHDNIRIELENIVITTSGQHGLDLVGRLFLNPGDAILVDLPTFAGALAAFEMEQPEVVGVPIEEDGSNVAAMEDKIVELERKSRKPKFIYVVPDFQNPSGITISYDKRKELLDLSYRHDIPIIEDSPYRELRYRGETIPSLYSMDENRGNVIGVYTFSKVFCPGMRVGFNIGPSEVIEKFGWIKGANILNTPLWNQDICLSFLTNYDLDSHFSRCVDYYRAKLNLFMKTLEKYFSGESRVRWTHPEGGLFLWITVPARIDSDELFFDAIEQQVAFVPGSVFYPKGNHEINHMRVNFSYPTEEQIVEGIGRLAGVIKDKIR